MGTVLQLLPKIIEMPGSGFGNFTNATGTGDSALYRKAQASYDAAIAKVTETNNKISKIQSDLAPLEGFVNNGRSKINDNNWNALYLDILGTGRYKANIMWPDYHTRFPLASMSDYTSDIYTGLSRMGYFLEVQKSLIREAIEAADNKAAEMRKEIASLTSTLDSQQRAAERAKKDVDYAIGKEQMASDQRIKENLTSPEFIKAQAEAAQKKRTTYAVVAIVGLAIAVGGAALIFKK